MAVTVERMVAVLEARIDGYEKALAKAGNTTDARLTEIEARFRALEDRIAGVGTAAQPAFGKLDKGLKSTTADVGNLAAQFNDIGVQLAGGQSPLLIALQQGSQITQAFGGAGVRGAIAGVGGAFASLLSPVSLATIAIITLGGLAIQYFADMVLGGEKAKMTLEQQASLITQVAKEWGEAVPGLKAYVDELERAKSVSDLQAAGNIKIAEDQASINAALDEFIKKNQDVVDAITRAYDATGRSTESLSKFAAEWLELEKKIRAGTATQDDFTDATRLLRGAVADSGGDLDTFAGQFDTIAGRIANALKVLQDFQQQMRDALITGIKTQSQIQGLTSGQINNPNLPDPNFRLPKDGPLPGEKPNLLDYDPNATGGRSSARQSAYDAATKSLEERTAAAKAQLEVQQKLNPLVNDYGYAMEFAKARQELLTAAQKANREVTPQLAAEIDKIAVAYANTTAALAKLAEQNKLTAESIAFQKDLVNGALSDIRSALEDGKLTWEDLGNVAVNVLNKIADKLQSMLVDQMFAKGFGGLFGLLGGGGLVGGLSGAGGGGVGGFAPGASAAKAASVSATAAAKAAKLPAGVLAKASGPVDVRVSVDDEGALRAYVMKEGRRTEARVAAGVKATHEAYRRGQFHSDVDSHLRQPRRRGSI